MAVEDNESQNIKNILNSVDEIAEIISWTVLIYFLFQMQELKNKFDSETVGVFMAKQKRTTLYSGLAYSWIALSTLTSLAVMLYVVISQRKLSLNDEQAPLWLFYTDLAICVVEIFIELVIAYSFYSVFCYFIELKVNKMRSLCLELTLANRLVIVWIYTLIAMNTLSALCRCFQTPLLELIVDPP